MAVASQWTTSSSSSENDDDSSCYVSVGNTVRPMDFLGTRTWAPAGKRSRARVTGSRDPEEEDGEEEGRVPEAAAAATPQATATTPNSNQTPQLAARAAFVRSRHFRAPGGGTAAVVIITQLLALRGLNLWDIARQTGALNSPDLLWPHPEALQGFREFLQQLQQKCAEPPEPLTSSASRHQRAVPQHCRGSHQCPHCSFLPDLCRPHGAQVPKVKAVPTRSSSGEASGPRRRCCPFRVRFADETLQDTALRYWERNCAVRQHITENRTSTLPAVSERLLGSVGRWLESLPKTLNPRAKEEALTSSCWNFPSPPTQEPQGHFSEDTPMNNRLPYIPRATTQRQRGDLRSLLNTHNILEQVGKSPSSLGPKLLGAAVSSEAKPPQGVPALLPSMTLRQAQR
ncbi:uncharacterized protein C9orf50 homolog [Microcebus murinus]|uniref:uncharacterized protein C9orf50 homolog n=1 Tax=Microcebus murinus TaxID=30608 RepID=UPI003F6C9874